MRLPRDYRGLPRPSSAPCAKASAVRPEYLRGTGPLRPPIMFRSLEKSLPLRAMRLSGCPLMTLASHGGRTLRGLWGSSFHSGRLLRLRLCLPRKEVIQPHLPVRLPCYDFTPLTLHTFDASAPFRGSAGGFGCRRLGWCDGRCVQGPGTHSPRRADPRLLATPTSRGRVAAPGPNWGRL